jgi:hypothetical protein
MLFLIVLRVKEPENLRGNIGNGLNQYIGGEKFIGFVTIVKGKEKFST